MQSHKHTGTVIEFLYNYTIYAGSNPSYMKTKCMYPTPSYKWQFEIYFTNGVDRTPYSNFVIDDDDDEYQMHVKFLSLNKNEPQSIKISGVISINGVHCPMSISSIPFAMDHQSLVNGQIFVFEKLMSGESEDILGDDSLELVCKMFIWGLDPPTPIEIKSDPKENLVPCPMLSYKLVSDFKRMYNDSIATDIVFTVDGEIIKAHKFILCARSPVFQSMFETEMLESNTNCIPIVDCDIVSFKKFLQFLYSGELDESDHDALLPLYETADKYCVTDLQEACAQRMCSSLAVDNAIPVFVYAHLHNDEKMKCTAKEFIVKNFIQIACKRTWAELLINNSNLVDEINEKLAIY